MKIRAFFLLVIGTLQMMGEVFNSALFQNVAFASGASLAPKVFSGRMGIEGFASVYFLEWKTKDGQEHSLRVDHKVLEKLNGPQARRNIYTAAFPASPAVPAELTDSLLRYIFCGPLLRQWGGDYGDLQLPVRLRTIPLTAAQYPSVSIDLGIPCP
jgi:hypothetical protein